MNSATRRLIAALRHTAYGTLTIVLFLGCFWGLAGPASAVPEDSAYDTPVDTEPYAVGGPWQAQLPMVYGGWPAGAPDSWSSPVANYRISGPYGIRGNWAAGHHTGVDLAVPVGTPVRSVGSGTVVSSAYSGDYGNAITIRMEDHKYTLFAHLSTREVKKGDRVKAGTPLGKSGNTGRTTGPHLHFEVRTSPDYGSDIDPVSYLAEHGVRIA